MNATVLKRDGDQNVHQRFGVTRDGENLFVRHHVRVIAEQFPTARDRDRFWLFFRTIASPKQRRRRLAVRAREARPLGGETPLVDFIVWLITPEW